MTWSKNDRTAMTIIQKTVLYFIVSHGCRCAAHLWHTDSLKSIRIPSVFTTHCSFASATALK